MSRDRAPLQPLLVTILLATFPFPAQAARPEWADRPPPFTPDTLFFVGSSSAAKTEEEARDLAVQNALAGLVAYFGQSIQTRQSVEQVDRNRNFQQEIRVSIQIEGRSVPVKGWQVRQVFMENGGKGLDAWVLIAYPRAEYEATQAELQRNDLGKAQVALAAWREGCDLLAQGQASRAAERLDQARRILHGLPTIALGAEVPDTDVLAHRIDNDREQARQVIEQAARTVVAKVVWVPDGQPSPVGGFAAELEGELPSLVAAHGLMSVRPALDDARLLAAAGGDAAASAEAGCRSGGAWLLVVRLETRQTSEVYGQYFAEATGAVVLLETATGRVISGSDLGRSKGGHVSRRDAASKAAAGLRDAMRLAIDGALERIRKP